MDKYDGLTFGDLVTELYLESDKGEPISKQILSEAINKEYDLKLRLDLDAQDLNVKNDGVNDTSKVFEVVKKFEQLISDNQINLEQKTKIYDSFARDINSTLSGQLQVSENIRLSGGLFNGTLPDTNYFDTTLVANGTATIKNSELKLTTTNDTNSSALVNTKALARQIGGSMNEFRTRIRLDSGVTNNIRRWGLFSNSNLNDSAYFELNGTKLSIIIKTTDLANIVYDLDYILDTNYHIYQILYINGGFEFYINDELVYTAMETSRVLCGTRHLKAFVSNVGVASNMYIKFMTIITHGTRKTQPKYNFQQRITTDVGTLLKTGIGSLHSIILSGIANGCVVTLYDSLTATGNLIWSSGTMGPQTAPFNITFNDGIQFENGLYITITTGNGNANILYE